MVDLLTAVAQAALMRHLPMLLTLVGDCKPALRYRLPSKPIKPCTVDATGKWQCVCNPGCVSDLSCERSRLRPRENHELPPRWCLIESIEGNKPSIEFDDLSKPGSSR